MTVAADHSARRARAPGKGAPAIRLLEALAGAEHGGAEVHFVRLCVALKRAGVNQRVLMRPHEARIAGLRRADIEPVEAPFGGRLDFVTRRIFTREIARFRPNVVLTYMSRASRMCPKGDFVHIARLGGYYNLKYYRHCDHLVGITPDLVGYFVEYGWPRERTHFIPNFVEDRTARPVDRRPLETPAGAPLVFALGRLHGNKGFDVLLEAIARRPGTYLWLAGEGPLRGELEVLAARLGLSDRVRFLGWRDDPAPYFAAADVLVVPSRHEPLGSVLLEGWMHRLAVVAAASQGPRFLIADGDNGLLVPVDDPAALAEAIARILDDGKLAARLAARGRAAYEADYTEAAAVSRYLELFQRVLR
jgi:glycosyltransferase involved in cell wall biosynthesis